MCRIIRIKMDTAENKLPFSHNLFWDIDISNLLYPLIPFRSADKAGWS